MSESAEFEVPTQEDFHCDLRALCLGAIRLTLEMLLDEEIRTVVGAGRWQPGCPREASRALYDGSPARSERFRVRPCPSRRSLSFMKQFSEFIYRRLFHPCGATNAKGRRARIRRPRATPTRKSPRTRTRAEAIAINEAGRRVAPDREDRRDGGERKTASALVIRVTIAFRLQHFHRGSMTRCGSQSGVRGDERRTQDLGKRNIGGVVAGQIEPQLPHPREQRRVLVALQRQVPEIGKRRVGPAGGKLAGTFVPAQYVQHLDVEKVRSAKPFVAARERAAPRRALPCSEEELQHR